MYLKILTASQNTCTLVKILTSNQSTERKYKKKQKVFKGCLTIIFYSMKASGLVTYGLGFASIYTIVDHSPLSLL